MPGRLNLAVLVSGSGTNLQAILDAVAAGRLDADVRGVVSNVPGVRALERAEAAGVPSVVMPHKAHPSREAYDRALVETVRGFGADLVVLAGFMRLLSPVFLSAFPDRITNLHPALLPAFPGLNAVGQALAYGVKVSGCTVHLVDAGTDTGPILAQAVVPVLPDDTEERLAARIHAEEHRLYPEVLQWIAEGRLVREGRRVHFTGLSARPGVLTSPEAEGRGS